MTPPKKPTPRPASAGATKPDPFRETITIARGPNDRGLADLTAAAHGQERPAAATADTPAPEET